MDLAGRLAQLEEIVRDAKSMPLSSSVLISRDEVLELLHEMQEALPEEIKQARWIVKDREELLAKARAEGDRIIEQAHEEQRRMAMKTEVAKRGEEEAAQVLQEAEDTTGAMRREAEDYVDGKLAQFEISLRKILEDAQGTAPGRWRRRWIRSSSAANASARRRRRPSSALGDAGGAAPASCSTPRRTGRTSDDAGAIDVHDLLGQPGTSRRSDVLGTIDGLATELVAVPDDAPLGGALLLESRGRGHPRDRRRHRHVALRCARCLTERQQPVQRRGERAVRRGPPEDPTRTTTVRARSEGTIDLEQMIRDAVGVEMPFSPLCRPDCQGLCPRSAAATATSASARRPRRRSTRGARSCPTCCSSSRTTD